jgi:DUF4097 and DUF4098 domain-containing protein YvlB
VTITTSPTKIVATGSSSYREVHLHNVSGDIFIGGENTVSTTNGVKVENNSHDIMTLPKTAELWAVVNSGTATIYVLEIDK